ncbi:hypothetical protein ACFP2T_35805 [Plantactinospora solaniradicis]|uniref:Uncharacterized protein n=1 Tax=Plantactinospora solaniradicis TaxID=1723736 RepID=A0ABW1KK79_9ACTN
MTADDVAELVTRVAGVVAADYPDVSVQEVTDHLLAVVERVDLDYDDTRTAGVLVLVAEEYAGRRRAEALSTSAQYSYRRSDVALILSTTFDRGRWLGGHVPRDARSRRGEMDAVEVQADVTEALMSLSKARRYRLWQHYGLGNDDHPYDTDAALTELVDVLNDYRRRKRC